MAAELRSYELASYPLNYRLRQVLVLIGNQRLSLISNVLEEEISANQCQTSNHHE